MVLILYTITKAYFYFSDFYQLEQSVTAFDRGKRINVDEHPLLFADNKVLHKYIHNMQEQIVTGNIIGTSTVVYNFAYHPLLRFREDLVRAGEDYLFWLDLTKDTTGIAFSSASECVYGKGVNIYSGTKFGTPEYFDLIFYETKYRKIILREFELSETAKIKIKEKLKALGLNYIRAVVGGIRERRSFDISLFLKYLRLSPELVFYTPIHMLKLLRKK